VPAQNAVLDTDYTPSFTWKKAARAAYYRLYVVGPSGALLDAWYQGSQVCGATTCTVTEPVTITGGSHSWYVMSWNLAGASAWSEKTDFSTNILTLPSAVTGLIPTGTISDHTPTYQWDKDPMATWYHLYVKGPSGLVLEEWHQATAAECLGSTCSVDSPNLASGQHTWWVQTYNSVGYGPWKSATFTVSP
jgi:hypothetical protein